jgi:hypothetical protein
METTLEHILTNSYKADMICYLKSHPDDFEEAIRLAITNKQPYSWRAAWLLWSVMDKNDQRVKKHICSIINSIAAKNDDQKRELFIILQQMELDEQFEGMLFDICVDTWGKISKKPSVRYNAFKLMIKIAKKHSDLSHEVFTLTQNHYMDSLSDTVNKSVSKMIKELKRE